MASHPFLSLTRCKYLEPVARHRGVSEVARGPRGFLTAYKRAGGRAGLSEAWLAKREAFIARHLAQIKKNRRPLYGKDGVPTRQHLALIMWAYSPDPAGIARFRYRVEQR